MSGLATYPYSGIAHIPVQVNNHQVSVLFLVADIAGDKALLGHRFLSKAPARLDFENHRIVLFGEEVPYIDYKQTKSARSEIGPDCARGGWTGVCGKRQHPP